MSKPEEPKVEPKIELTAEELQNIISIVSTHPTPLGVGSQEGQVKIQLVNKLSQMINPKAS